MISFKQTSPRGLRKAATLVALTASAAALTPAVAQAAEVPTTASECVKADKVWVEIETGDAATSTGGCATEFATGIDALKSAATNAGFSVDSLESSYGEYVTGINGVSPEWSESNPVYWSYFNGTVGDNGKVSWVYNATGASNSAPQAGSVEGWKVGDGKTVPALSTVAAPSAATGSSSGFGVFGAFAALLALITGILATLGNPGIVILPRF